MLKCEAGLQFLYRCACLVGEYFRTHRLLSLGASAYILHLIVREKSIHWGGTTQGVKKAETFKSFSLPLFVVMLNLIANLPNKACE